MNDFNAFAAPITKLIELNKAQFEKMAAAQQEAAKNYAQLTEARIKAAVTIKDADALNTFVKEQVELAQSGLEKIVADSKSLFEDTKAYNEQVLNIVKESTAGLTPKK
ncbi:MAG: phasin family protein [Cycloclasticus sp.]|jgi:phasin family protein|nr:phasin family protein [Cycloclasticus sp.]MDF1689629.1 phasin family protein [Cycloclasticus sp.]MEE4291858.1 phasin family protein [Cycloclasticus sp.]